jgi:hypothetical protein
MGTPCIDETTDKKTTHDPSESGPKYSQPELQQWQAANPKADGRVLDFLVPEPGRQGGR